MPGFLARVPCPCCLPVLLTRVAYPCYLPALLTAEESLDFLQTGDTEGAREDTFFLETEVALLFCEGTEFIRL